MAALGDRATAPMARWTAAADAWCAAALWPTARAPSPGVVREWIAAATGRTDDAARCGSCGRRSTRAREIAAGHRRVSLGAGVSRSVLWRRGASERRRRLRRGDRQPAVGHVARRYRFIVATLGHASADGGAVALLPFVAVLSASGQRTSEQLPAVPRARAAARQAGGRVGLILPSGIATDHGSAALRRHLFDRTSIDTWIGFDNRAPHLPDSSQRAVRRDVDDQRRLRPRHAAVPLRPHRSGRARSRRARHRTAVARRAPASRRGVRST